MSYPLDLKYSDQHEWIRVDGDVAIIGITDHAQEQLGDIVFIDMPDLDTQVAAGESVMEVESVKAVSDIYSPVSGVIVGVNDALDGSEETVNRDPHAEGWLFKVKMSAPAELDALMDAGGYAALIAD